MVVDPRWVPPAPAPLSATGHWQLPDYQALLQGDPGVIAARAALEAGTTAAGAGRTNAIRQALIKWGIVPKGQDLGEAADPATLAAAQQNPYSVAAGYAQQRSRGSADLQAALAARGMLLEGGGALTGGEQGVTNAYEANMAGGTNELLKALGEYQGTYAGQIAGLQGGWSTALGAGAGRVQANYPGQWLEDPTVEQPAGEVQPYGENAPALGSTAVMGGPDWLPQGMTYDQVAAAGITPGMTREQALAAGIPGVVRPPPAQVKPPTTFVPTARGQRRYTPPRRLPRGLV